MFRKVRKIKITECQKIMKESFKEREVLRGSRV